jgi:hypothetical protein
MNEEVVRRSKRLLRVHARSNRLRNLWFSLLTMLAAPA